MDHPVARPPAFLCAECQVEPKCNHPNAKYCHGCRERLRRQPRSRVTPGQAAHLRPLLGTLPKRDIARRVGISLAALTRWLREEGLHSDSKPYDPALVAAVLRVYEHGGTPAVRQLFPGVRVRSIVERYKDFQPRQIRWTGPQTIEAARMAGLVTHTAQARYFGRPGAWEGSIKSLWIKRFQCPPRDVNGLGVSLAWWIATPGTPAVVVKHSTAPSAVAKVLWLDLVQHLRPDVPDWVRDAVQVLARFQTWLHGTDDPAAIRAMIQEREAQYGEYGRPGQQWRGTRRPARGHGAGAGESV